MVSSGLGSLEDSLLGLQMACLLTVTYKGLSSVGLHP